MYVCHILSRSHFEYMKTKCRQTIDPLAVLEYTIQKFLTQAVDYALLMLWEKLLCHIKETFSAWFSWTAFKLRPLQPTIRMQHQPGRMVVWAPLLGVLCMQSNVSQVILWQQLIIYERTKLENNNLQSSKALACFDYWQASGSMWNIYYVNWTKHKASFIILQIAGDQKSYAKMT